MSKVRNQGLELRLTSSPGPLNFNLTFCGPGMQNFILNGRGQGNALITKIALAIARESRLGDSLGLAWAA